MGRVAKVASVTWPGERTRPKNERVDESSIHVLVVDEDGAPVTGQDVAAHFSYARVPDTVSYHYTDVEGHAGFSCEHPAEPLHVKLVVRGESFGPYTVEKGARYTVDISRE